MENNMMSVVFVLGLPGAGKGTQCTKLAEKYGCCHISAGDLLRKVRADVTSPYRQEVEEHLKVGKLVRVEIIVSVLRSEIERYCNFVKTLSATQPSLLILIDGFPRNLETLHGFENAMSDKAVTKAVLLFEGQAEPFIERCLKRTGRPEDTPETLKFRVENFRTQSMPVVQHFKERGILHCIDTSCDQEAAFKQAESTLQSMGLLKVVQ